MKKPETTDQEHSVKCDITTYFAIDDNDSGYKWEYDGKFAIRMQAGASTNHLKIQSNLHGLIWNVLKESDCNVFSSDTRVESGFNDIGKYRYPDLSIFCKDTMQIDGIIHKNPVVLIEIVSDRTALTDYVKKLEEYRRIPSLKYYLIIEQNRRYILVHERRLMECLSNEYTESESISLSLNDTQIILTLDEIYKGTNEND